jgi:hypothetical protein
MNDQLNRQPKVQDALYKYNGIIRLAKLDNGSKSLLRFYADTYNWSQDKPSRYSERQICALEGITANTYLKRRKRLEELGWITVKYLGPHTPCHVWINIGEDDPAYEKFSFAKWHPSNRTEVEEEFIKHDPFSKAKVQILDVTSINSL